MSDFPRARVLPNGIIQYLKKGWEPPPPIEGYDRDPGNKWRFLPIWPACKFRKLGYFRKQCGAMQCKAVCLCADCPLFNKELKLSDCKGCPYGEKA